MAGISPARRLPGAGLHRLLRHPLHRGRMIRAAVLLPLLLVAACDQVRPSPVRTDCVTRGRNPIPVCPEETR